MLFKNENASVMQLFSLKGHVSVITGGSRGIGLAVAVGLAEAGSDIAITYNSSNTKTIDEIEAQITALGVKFKAYQCNVAVKKDIEDTIQTVYKDFGKLNVVVPNAGIAIHEPSEDVSEENYRSVMGVNLDGAFFTAQAAGKVFKEQVEKGLITQGRLIFTASVSSLIVNFPQKQAVYNASKAGLVRLAKCLSVEWVNFARVNCVSPGYIETDMIGDLPQEWQDQWYNQIPAERYCSSYELKGVYVFLASNASSYVVGEEVVVAGGYTLK